MVNSQSNFDLIVTIPITNIVKHLIYLTCTFLTSYPSLTIDFVISSTDILLSPKSTFTLLELNITLTLSLSTPSMPFTALWLLVH